MRVHDAHFTGNHRFARTNVSPQNLGSPSPAPVNRNVFAPTQPGTTGPQNQQQRFQGKVTPGNQGPTILRGGSNPQPQTGPQGQTQGQGADQRFRGQVGNLTVVPQGHTVTPQFQPVKPHVVTPPPSRNRGVEQDRRGQGGNGN